MNIDDLFPNSTDKLIKIIQPVLSRVDPREAEAITMLADRALEHTHCTKPITIELREAGGTYYVAITRGGVTMDVDHTGQKEHAQYYVAKWKHVLLGHDEPTSIPDID